MDSVLKDGERIDNTGFGDLIVIQGDGFSYGVDSVLLADFASRESGNRIAELGSGNGVVSFILAHKSPAARITGFEIQEEACGRAVRGCGINGLTDRIEFITADVADIAGVLSNGRNTAFEQYRGAFDAVVTNPPYFLKGTSPAGTDEAKYIARHETTADLGAFIAAAGFLLRERGDFYMVHRPSRMADVFSEMRRGGIEPKELRLVTPRPGEAANIMLIHGIKGAGREMRMLPDLNVRNADGEYSEELEKIYERI